MIYGFRKSAFIADPKCRFSFYPNMEGWLKLHRSILHNAYFSNPQELKIWVWILCKASISDRFITLKIGRGTQTVSVKRGQFIFGRNKAEQELNIDSSTIYRVIQRMAVNGSILIEPNNHFSIITVCKFIEYQQSEEIFDFDVLESEQAMNNQRTSNEQQTNSKRAAGEQQVNSRRTQYKNVLEGKEGIEGSEGKKVKKERGAAAPAPPFYPEFMAAYFDFFKARNGGTPQISTKDGAGLKTIISFMRAQVKARHPEFSELEIGENSVKGFSWILSRWGDLTKYHQQKISLCEMASVINPIFDHLKSKSDGRKQAKDLTVNDLARAANEYINGNGGNQQ